VRQDAVTRDRRYGPLMAKRSEGRKEGFHRLTDTDTDVVIHTMKVYRASLTVNTTKVYRASLTVTEDITKTTTERNWHSLMLRISGFSTDGEMDSVRLVGPRPPATYLFIPATLIILTLMTTMILI